MDPRPASESTGHAATGQSPFVASIFIFNLIVGTGALTMPKAFAQAGWLFSTVIVIFLAIMSFMSVTFVIESMSIANYVEKKLRHQTSGVSQIASSSDPTNDLDEARTEETSLFRNTTSKWYDITIEKQLLDMAKMFLPPLWLKFASITLCLYLYGDLVIYSAAISKSARDVTCSFFNETSNSVDTCLIFNHVLTRSALYRIYVVVISSLVSIFAYFNAKKSTPVQVVTTLYRWLAFLSMIILTTIILSRGQGKGSPQTARISGVPNLFGVCVYSFMCHHSLPLFITPIRRKDKCLYKVIISDYLLILLFYLLLSFTAIYTFDDLQQIYTLNFQKASSSSFEIITSIPLLHYFLPLFPVFTLSSSFPIIAISLQKNLSLIVKPFLLSIFSRNSYEEAGEASQSLLQVSSASSDAEQAIFVSPRVNFCIDRLILPTLAVVPPILVALTTEDLSFWVSIVASYAGVAVQYVTPALIILHARRKLRPGTIEELTAPAARIRDKLKSPFKQSGYIWFTFTWAVMIWLLVTVNYFLNSHPDNE